MGNPYLALYLERSIDLINSTYGVFRYLLACFAQRKFLHQRNRKVAFLLR